LIHCREPSLNIVDHRFEEYAPAGCATDPDTLAGQPELARKPDSLAAAIAEELSVSRLSHDRP
jgi:hypothetical protein